MMNRKKLFTIALMLILVGLIGSIITFNSINNPVTVDEKKIINNNDIANVEIDADNEQVEIISTKDSTTKVELIGKSSSDKENYLSADVKGNTLAIEVNDHNMFHFFDFIGTSLTLKVYLPEKMYETLQVDIDNGSAHAEQLNIKEIHAETNNGHIELEDIMAHYVNVASDNGKLSLRNVEGEIEGETDNGEISLVTKNLDRPIELECDNGRITIQTDREPTNATFNVHVDNGDINIFDKYSGNAVFGNGEYVIKLETNNGEISVTK
ncbi:DUF4097 family beta strand repeat-containing protein [Virgibacillus oceani]|uniref:DUF4097 domain-containing protein n=1 Tax=Virgibacillus oceani TaxID=1479511 RepID=A0A917HC11_9BACI|nr:DUF4097 family beta strand repeat-containing protein [Virgibacillus oceani]GGG74416.1 hypothetical protein GCM10011398_18850 [Virgibacillus oceani]